MDRLRGAVGAFESKTRNIEPKADIVAACCTHGHGEFLSRIIEYDEQKRLIRVRFSYDPALVQRIKALPSRRWDPVDKSWTLRLKALEQAWLQLKELGFRPTPKVAELLGIKVVELAPAPSREASRARGYSVGRLNEMARSALYSAFGRPLWVIGEVLGFERGQRARHAFFELIERREGHTIARVSTVIWGDLRPYIEERLNSADPPFQLADGLVVRMLVRVDLHGQSGRYQVVVQDIDPVYTLGDLALKRAAILRQLAQEGLERRNLSLALNSPPLRVALLTSPQGDALQDFLHELKASGLAFEVDLYPIQVQGQKLVSSTLTALSRVVRYHQKRPYDVVVLTRGGGSRVDLIGFDELDLARAVALCPIKVLVGIGHQRDQSVLDLIALSAKTPTACAALLVERSQRFLIEQAQLWQRIEQRSRRLLSTQAQSLRERGLRLGRAFVAQERQAAHQLELALGRLERAGDDANRRARQGLERASTRLAAQSQRHLRRSAERCFAASSRLTTSCAPKRFRRLERSLDDELRMLGRASRQKLNGLTRELNSAARALRLLDPARVLERGYALIRDPQGRVLSRASALEAGMKTQIVLRDGHAEAQIGAVELNESEEE